MSKLFFTADLHAWHNNIIKYQPATRRGVDADEMTELLVQAWNETVGPTDTTILAGDVSFDYKLKYARTPEFLGRLNGDIHLVVGNHDHRDMVKKCRDRFVGVSDLLKIKHEGQHIVVCHYPIDAWEGMEQGWYHLYGHVHGRRPLKGRSMDIGIDARPDNLMKPWSWQEINDILSTQPVLRRRMDDDGRSVGIVDGAVE